MYLDNLLFFSESDVTSTSVISKETTNVFHNYNYGKQFEFSYTVFCPYNANYLESLNASERRKEKKRIENSYNLRMKKYKDAEETLNSSRHGRELINHDRSNIQSNTSTPTPDDYYNQFNEVYSVIQRPSPNIPMVRDAVNRLVYSSSSSVFS